MSLDHHLHWHRGLLPAGAPESESAAQKRVKNQGSELGCAPLPRGLLVFAKVRFRTDFLCSKMKVLRGRVAKKLISVGRV